jgi:hypothetical protein
VVEESDVLFQVLDGLCVHHFSRRDLGRALVTSRELLALGERKRDRQIAMTGLRAFGSASFLLGDLGEAKASFRKLLFLYRPEEDANLATRTRTDPEVTARSFLSLALLIDGQADQAFAESALGIRAARELRHPGSIAFALRLFAFLAAVAGDWPEVLKAAEEVVELSEKHRFPVWRTEGSFFQAWAAFQLDGNRSDLERMRESLDAMAAGKAVWPFFLAAVGSAEALAGDEAAAERSFRAAADAASEHGERWYEPEIFRQRAEIHRRLSNTPSRAVAELETALNLARCQGAKLWELRAALSLARLWRDEGEDLKGRELLEPIYTRFTEGFATRDLVNARNMLQLLEEDCPARQATASHYQ